MSVSETLAAMANAVTLEVCGLVFGVLRSVQIFRMSVGGI
jgi:hypothetical protein